MNDHSQFPGALMLNIEGLELSQEDTALLSRPSVGGLILFSRNYSDPAQLRELVEAIRECSPEIIIAVDQEGGRVQRFREGFVTLPPLRSLAEIYEQDKDLGLELIRTHAWVMASEILLFGIDISFAPVLDLYNPASKVIAERAFSDEVSETVQMCRAYISGMHEAGMIATGKHFPGHGTVVADSHETVPVDNRPADEILAKDFQVFAQCADLLDAIMPAHVVYPEIDSECAGFSQVWIQQKLRGQLDFQGTVFSDDLSMAAAKVAGEPAVRAEKALSAGCDVVLACNDRDSALAIADFLEASSHPGSAKLASLRGSPAADIADLYSSERWENAVASLQSMSSLVSGRLDQNILE